MSTPLPARTRIAGATVVSMDDALGVIDDGFIEIVDGVIASVGRLADAPPATPADTVIDASGFIVCPGLINAHMHTWQTALRGMASNWTLMEYFRWMHAGLGTLFTPEDIRIA
ncbi:MAG: cytosine deaminase, partial [Comamonadaceae bacterium]